MPAAPLDVDWQAVQAHAIIHGARQAARDFNLPEETVKKRCTREGWLRPQPVPTIPGALVKHVPNVPTASQAALTARERRDARIHRNGVGYADHTLRYAHRTARKEPEKALALAADVKAVVSIAQAANVAGFERRESGTAGVVVNLAILDRPTEAVSTNQSQQG